MEWTWIVLELVGVWAMLVCAFCVGYLAGWSKARGVYVRPR